MDFYTVLGVSKNATQTQIKEAYKALAIKYHPDKIMNKSQAEKAEITKKFLLIKEAYDVLKSETTRKQYDFDQNLRNNKWSFQSSTYPRDAFHFRAPSDISSIPPFTGFKSHTIYISQEGNGSKRLDEFDGFHNQPSWLDFFENFPFSSASDLNTRDGSSSGTSCYTYSYRTPIGNGFHKKIYEINRQFHRNK